MSRLGYVTGNTLSDQYPGTRQTRQGWLIIIMSYKTEVFIDRNKVKQPSSFAKFIGSLCPCLKKKTSRAYKLDTISEKEDHLVQNQSEMDEFQFSKTQSRTQSTKPSFIHSLSLSSKYDTDVEDYFTKKITPETQIHKYVSVRRYQQDRLILFGTKRKILLKIHTKILKMSAHSAEKTKATLDKVSIKTPKFPNAKMEGWWKKRYILFDKFDQGIKFDQESYNSTPPESLTSYIASRLKFNNIIHAYAGIGAYDIKLSNICENIVATDISEANRDCIMNNFSVYMIDNVEISEQSFLTMPGQKVDAVLITPPWGQSYSVHQELDISTLKIDQLFARALTMSSNVVLVLPSNINMEKLGDLLSKGLYQASSQGNENCYSSCSFEIQKICFMDRIRFIIVYYGTFVTKEIKLPEELDMIYDIIGNATFKCRRITKYIRQHFGLPYLLQLALRVESETRSGVTKLDRLIEIIEQERIIPDAKLKSFLNKNMELKKTNSRKLNTLGVEIHEEEMSEISEARESQKTQTYTNSFISSYDMGGRDQLQGTRRTINIQCSGTGSIKLSKNSLQMSIDPEMVKTKIR